jgi:hypothetical protein|tara:strand:- start:408 stop:686 length:279 start_codon:yes stop_codon:yes gene_type:complete
MSKNAKASASMGAERVDVQELVPRATTEVEILQPAQVLNYLLRHEEELRKESILSRIIANSASKIFLTLAQGFCSVYLLDRPSVVIICSSLK